ncbi:MAG: hypothetical protein Ta2B_03510 [Termitinemataceae bacterium]|nr:MAG: hypothetical protein Ta2B_03510 [Termitinemataceae bacterium]
MKETEKTTSDYIQWHPAFIEALKHDLSSYKDVLTFKDEHQLTAAPLKIDVLVIKKEKNVVIKNKIAALFLPHNIVEYKSPDDYLSINNFYKAFAYLYLYKSFENIDITDMTLTFSVSHYPREVIKHLQNVRKLNVTKKYNGIYYVTGDLIPIQFIINTELDEDENLFLNSLTRSISENRINTLFDEIAKTEKAAEESITAFIDAVVRGNKEKFAEVAKMSDLSSLAEIFEGTKCAEIWETHGIERGREEGRKEGRKEGIKKERRDVLNILNNCRDLEEAKKKLMSMGV